MGKDGTFLITFQQVNHEIKIIARFLNAALPNVPVYETLLDIINLKGLISEMWGSTKYNPQMSEMWGCKK